ncbi:RA domain-containing protein rau [Dermatophagoides pteronyssinus]|uniref:RA domain-containing protein rau n=1 Tax=Dermatophagoides pteronyssinus TaxID=6956 RepID=UPI003F67DF58
MLKYVSTPMPTSTLSVSNDQQTMFNVDLKRQSSSSTSSSDSISLNSSDCSSNGSSSIMNDSIESPITHHHSNNLLVPVIDNHHHHLRSWSSSSSSISSLPSLITDNVPLSPSSSSSINHSTKTVSSTNTIDRKVVIKIFTRVLCTDVEYKTLSISNHTTSREIVQMILKKFRLNHRDPNLFYLTLEAWIKQTGIPIRSVMTLDDDACPALLQSCYRQKDLKFTLVMRRGENVRIHNRCQHGPSTLNILLSDRTNVEELTRLVTGILDLPTDNKQSYELYVYSPSCKIEQKLSPTDRSLAIRMEWPNQDFNRFEIRPYQIQHNYHHQYIDNNNSNDSRLIMADFRKNFKSEFAMNLLGAANHNKNITITAENRNQHCQQYHHHHHHHPHSHYQSHPHLQLEQQHSTSKSTTGKVLYI